MKYPAKNGVQLQLGDGAPTEVFTEIVQLSSIGGLNLTQDQIDVTTLDSVGGYREYLDGLKDGGEIPCSGLWDPAAGSHDETTGIVAKFDSGGVHNFRMVFSGPGKTVAFAALVSSITVGEAEVAGALGISFSLKVSGQPTWS